MSWIALLSLALAPSAWAHFCTPPGQVQSTVKFCQENEKFVHEAISCQARLAAEVESASRLLAGQYAKGAEKFQSSQLSQLSNEETDLKAGSKKLTELENEARFARADMLEYQQRLLYPGEPGRDLLSRNGLQGFLSTFPCYRRQHSALNSEIRKMDEKYLNLRASNLAANSLRKSVQAGEVKLVQFGTPVRKGMERTRHQLGQASGPAFSKTNATASTITGKIPLSAAESH